MPFRDRLIFSSLLVILIAQLLFNPIVVYAAAPIYITAIQTNGGTGHTDEDFVELFNPNDAPVNLKGYRLVKRSAQSTTDTSLKSWTSDATIPSHGFYLWANSSLASAAVVPDAATSGTLSDDNGLALRLGAENAGLIIDSVAWGNASNTFNNVSATNPKANQSLVRQSLYDTAAVYTIIDNHQSRNSAVIDAGPNSNPVPNPVVCPPAPTPVPTVTTELDPTPSANADPTPPPVQVSSPNLASNSELQSEILDVTISEFLPNPAGSDSGAEMVELHNAGSQAANISGWSLNNQKAAASGLYTLSSVVVPANGYLAITIPKGYFSMVNTGDSISLYDQTHQLADQVAYTGSAPEGKSYQKVGERWLWGDPSFGSENQIQETALVGVTATATKTASAKSTTTSAAKSIAATISSTIVKQLKSQIAKLRAAIDILPDSAAAQQGQSADLSATNPDNVNVANPAPNTSSSKRRLIEFGLATIFLAVIIWAALKAYRTSKED